MCLIQLTHVVGPWCGQLELEQQVMQKLPSAQAVCVQHPGAHTSEQKCVEQMMNCSACADDATQAPSVPQGLPCPALHRSDHSLAVVQDYSHDEEFVPGVEVACSAVAGVVDAVVAVEEGQDKLDSYQAALGVGASAQQAALAPTQCKVGGSLCCTSVPCLYRFKQTVKSLGCTCGGAACDTPASSASNRAISASRSMTEAQVEWPSTGKRAELSKPAKSAMPPTPSQCVLPVPAAHPYLHFHRQQGEAVRSDLDSSSVRHLCKYGKKRITAHWRKLDYRKRHADFVY